MLTAYSSKSLSKVVILPSVFLFLCDIPAANTLNKNINHVPLTILKAYINIVQLALHVKLYRSLSTTLITVIS